MTNSIMLLILYFSFFLLFKSINDTWYRSIYIISIIFPGAFAVLTVPICVVPIMCHYVISNDNHRRLYRRHNDISYRFIFDLGISSTVTLSFTLEQRTYPFTSYAWRKLLFSCVIGRRPSFNPSR